MDMKVMYDEDDDMEWIGPHRLMENVFSVDLDEGVKNILLKHLSSERAFMVDTELRELFQKGNSDNVQDWCNSKSEIEFPKFEIKDPYALDRI